MSKVASLTRLEKLDFWLRNPDYLAIDLMTDYEDGLLIFDEVQPHVQRMLSGGAPSLHRYPMSRYLYGAYDRVDNALSILKTYGQIAHRRNGESGGKTRRDYFLLRSGRETLQRMRAGIPELRWYDEQAAAIMLLADAAQGASARRRQYKHPEYKDADHGSLIPPILDRVLVRADELGFALLDDTNKVATA
ncbi:hypothetical protein J2W14_003026 [Pseudarthrobacter oxydans]|uniref:hypothetical protein n=1 Tax=Pseudarthrobacter oxydans TaxID=1671 RepID=UPI002780E4EE|nr:hypothetical protein [Pseudarthrobacter oxydans]MDP9983605.1 hypothetical protein [Pseudarthrobacter oxydans]